MLAKLRIQIAKNECFLINKGIFVENKLSK